MRGSVAVTFESGVRTRFVFSLPLTLTTVRAILASVGEEVVAFDVSTVARLLRVSPTELRSVEEREVLTLGATPVPIMKLSAILGLRPAASDRIGAKLPVVIVTIGQRHAALVVDELLDEQELVVRSVGPRLSKIRHVAAAAILPTGRVVLLLNSAALLATALDERHALTMSVVPQRETTQVRKRLLLVDDSMTTRALEKNILEMAGYEVAAAVDGEEAWRQLQENGADLVVSDVEMPGMDGLALTEAIRSSPRFKHVPVILVTGRENAQDRSRGLEAGADSYVVKSAFDQRQLLQIISELL
jgi:two-component system chemotaxis sensor kinase CheA